MTGGSHDHPDKYLGVAWRTVRWSLADCPRGRCYTFRIMPPSAAYIGLRMMLILICRQKVPVSSSFLVRRLMYDDDSSTTNVES